MKLIIEVEQTDTRVGKEVYVARTMLLRTPVIGKYRSSPAEAIKSLSMMLGEKETFQKMMEVFIASEPLVHNHPDKSDINKADKLIISATMYESRASLMYGDLLLLTCSGITESKALDGLRIKAVELKANVRVLEMIGKALIELCNVPQAIKDILREKGLSIYENELERITGDKFRPQDNKVKTSQVSGSPHTCPVCNGTTIVPGNFYHSIQGQASTSNKSQDKCRSCTNGIVWG